MSAHDDVERRRWRSGSVVIKRPNPTNKLAESGLTKEEEEEGGKATTTRRVHYPLLCEMSSVRLSGGGVGQHKSILVAKFLF